MVKPTMPFSREEKQKAKAAMYNGINSEEQTRECRLPVENGHRQHDQSEEEISSQCCYPKGCLSPTALISWESVRFVCNSEQCEKSGMMHFVCAEAFEEDILTFLRSVGRARSWSDKQRRQ
ncbi:hypothetical protein, partial [Salmonella sp. s54925]|uniref:hypothetical protein n=1 Tax=Salmonella sp. s54925 TaxID=3159674 RepID=UPI00397ECA95